MNTVRREVAIINQRGLHARASAKFVNLVSELPDDVQVCVVRDGAQAAGGSILGLMMLGAAKGSSIIIEVTGNEPEGPLARLCQLVEDGFGEE